MNTTIVEYGPHTIKLSKPGWQTHQWKVNLKRAWQSGGINRVQHMIDVIFVDGKAALNLSERDPENELYKAL